MRKKSFLRATGVMLMALLFLSCIPAFSAPHSRVTITFWHAMEGARGRVLQSLVDRFNETHPGIFVEARFKGTSAPYANSYDDLIKALLVSLKENNPPTVSQVYENWTAQFMGVGAIAPIQKFADGKDGYSRSELADFVPAFLKSNEPDGKLLTLPFNKSLYVLYYNRDALGRAGLKPPATWDDLRKEAKLLTLRNSSGQTTRYGLTDLPNVDLFSLVFYAFGGDYFKNGKARFNGVTGQSALHFLESMASEKTFLPDYAALNDFVSGRAALYIDTTAALPYLDKHASFRVGMAAIPGQVRPVSLFAGTNLAIFRHANRLQQEAAWTFIRWLLEPQNMAEWCASTGYLPVRWSVLKTARYQAFLAGDPRWSVPLDQLHQAFTDPRVWAWESIRGFVSEGVEQAVAGKMRASKALDEAAERTNRLLAQ